MTTNISQLPHYLPSYFYTGHKHLTIITLPAFISLYWPQTSPNYHTTCLHISILATNISQLPHYLPSYLYIDHKHLPITTLPAFISLYWPQTSHNCHTTCLHISILARNISQLSQQYLLPAFISLYWPQTSHNYHTTCLHISILATNISQLPHYLPSYLYTGHKHLTITTLPAFISLFWPQTSHNCHTTCLHISILTTNISQLPQYLLPAFIFFYWPEISHNYHNSIYYLPSYLYTGHKHLTITTLPAFISLYWPQTSHNYHTTCLHISILATNISQLPHYLPSYLYTGHKHLTTATLPAFIYLYWPQTSHNCHSIYCLPLYFSTGQKYLTIIKTVSTTWFHISILARISILDRNISQLSKQYLLPVFISLYWPEISHNYHNGIYYLPSYLYIGQKYLTIITTVFTTCLHISILSRNISQSSQQYLIPVSISFYWPEISHNYHNSIYYLSSYLYTGQKYLIIITTVSTTCLHISILARNISQLSQQYLLPAFISLYWPKISHNYPNSIYYLPSYLFTGQKYLTIITTVSTTCLHISILARNISQLSQQYLLPAFISLYCPEISHNYHNSIYYLSPYLYTLQKYLTIITTVSTTCLHISILARNIWQLSQQYLLPAFISLYWPEISHNYHKSIYYLTSYLSTGQKYLIIITTVSTTCLHISILARNISQLSQQYLLPDFLSFYWPEIPHNYHNNIYYLPSYLKTGQKYLTIITTVFIWLHTPILARNIPQLSQQYLLSAFISLHW